MNILILDMTHGGDILTEEYLKRGHSVTCADVYGIATQEKKRELREMGAKVCDSASGMYDEVIMPAHCPDIFLEGVSFSNKRTFSNAVRELIEDDRFRIEVTGVKGKTSSCYLIAHILSTSGKKVFLHTSRGQGPWINGEHIIERNMSIAPTSLLRLPPDDYDCIVAEVSLGGSGKADIAVITNLVEDYGIARNTRKASDAKAEILTDGINIVREDEVEIWKRYDAKYLRTYGNNVRVKNIPRLGEPLEISFEYDGRQDVSLDPGYLSMQYIQAIDLALSICLSMGVPADVVNEGLRTFRGVPGRGEVSSHSGIWYVNDRNPGVSALSIRMALGCLREMDALNNAFVIVDPVSRKVCDKMDAEDIFRTIMEFGARAYFTEGTGDMPEIPDDTKVVVTFVKEGFQ